MADFIEIKNLVFEYVKDEDGQKYRARDDVSQKYQRTFDSDCRESICGRT